MSPWNGAERVLQSMWDHKAEICTLIFLRLGTLYKALKRSDECDGQVEATGETDEPDVSSRQKRGTKKHYF